MSRWHLLAANQEKQEEEKTCSKTLTANAVLCSIVVGVACLYFYHPRPATNYCLSTSIELHPGVAASVFPLATLWPSRGSPSRSPCYAARRRRFLDRAGWKQTAADTLQERPFVGQILAQRSKTRRGVSASPFRRPIRDIGTSFSQANAKGTCRG